MALPSVGMSRLRGVERVFHVGHNIPEKDFARRFPRTLYNLFTVFCGAVNICTCFMNGSEDPALVLEQQEEDRIICRDTYFQLLLREAGL